MKISNRTVKHTTNEKSWSDWWRKLLGISPAGYRDVSEILSSRYLAEMQHVQRYTEHAERMQYPQFSEKLLRIAANEARHAEWLAEKITLFGGEIPRLPVSPSMAENNWRFLLCDLEEPKNVSYCLSEQMQTVRAELPDIAAMLERIYQDCEKHRDEIRGMLMRSHPQPTWAAKRLAAKNPKAANKSDTDSPDRNIRSRATD